MVDEQLKQIKDEDKRNKAQQDIEKMCSKLANTSTLSHEQKEKAKLQQISKCQVFVIRFITTLTVEEQQKLHYFRTCLETQ